MVSGIQRVERILIVSPSATVARALSLGVRARRRTWVVTTATTTAEAMEALDGGKADTIVVDMSQGDTVDARRCLQTGAARHPEVHRIAVVTAATRDLPEVREATGSLPLRSDAERLCQAVEAAQGPIGADVLAAVG